LGVAIRRFFAQQMAREEILQAPLAIRAPRAVSAAGHDEILEIFARLD
jgi:hypothetical protein